jgi:hypothetical protein
VRQADSERIEGRERQGKAGTANSSTQLGHTTALVSPSAVGVNTGDGCANVPREETILDLLALFERNPSKDVHQKFF